MLQALFLSPASPQNVAGQCDHIRSIGQSAAGDFQFGQSTVVVAISAIKHLRPGQVRFSGIRSQAKGGLHRGFDQGEARGSVLVRDEIVEVGLRGGELAVGEKE